MYCQSIELKEIFRSRRALLLSASVLAITTGLVGSNQASAQCIPVGSTLTCTGDLSGGFEDNDLTIDRIEVLNLTSDFGRNGLTFRNPDNVDITVDANLGAFSINHGDIATFRNFRNGFNIRTGGGIQGSLIGDINGADPGQVQSFGTNTFLNNFGSLGLDAGGAINFTHTGDINVERFDTRVLRDTAQTATGRFGAIRAEADTGDVSLTNIGNIGIDGGQRTVASLDFGSDNIEVQAVQFSNQFSEHSGIFIQGDNALTLRQDGDITTTGGGANASGETREAETGDVVDARADGSRGAGVSIVRFTRRDGVIDTTLPDLDNVSVDINGDVTVTQGDIVSTARATSGVGANDIGTAVAITNQRSSLIGVQITNGSEIDVSIDGNVNVTGGNGTAQATTVSNDGMTRGFTHANARGVFATGVNVRPDTREATDPRNAELAIEGNVTVKGGDAMARVDGNAVPEINTLISDIPNFTPSNALVASGGSASGITFTGQLFSIDGEINANGGAATGFVDGLGLSGLVTGGSANALNIFLGATDLSMVGNITSTSNGGDAELSLTGSDGTGIARGGGSTGSVFAGTGTHTQTARLTSIGGNAIVTGAGNAAAAGGTATGYVVFDGADDPTFMSINQADISVIGGNATNSTNGVATGGAATGIIIQIGRESIANMRNDQAITAIGGDAVRMGTATEDQTTRGGARSE